MNAHIYNIQRNVYSQIQEHTSIFFPFYVSAIFSVYGQYFGFYFFLIN